MYEPMDYDTELRNDPAYEEWSRQLDLAWAARTEPTEAEVTAMLAAANLDRVPF